MKDLLMMMVMVVALVNDDGVFGDGDGGDGGCGDGDGLSKERVE